MNLSFTNDEANATHIRRNHYSDVIMGEMAFQITGVSIVYSTVYLGANQRKQQGSASLTFVIGIHRWPVNSQHKGASNTENVSIWWRHHDDNSSCGRQIWISPIWWVQNEMRCWISLIQWICGTGFRHMFTDHVGYDHETCWSTFQLLLYCYCWTRDRWTRVISFNTMRPRQDGRHFADDTLNRILVNENVRISIKFSMKFVPKGPINNIPALVQVMAWRRPGDKPLSDPVMVSLLAHICVTRPQWNNNWWLMKFFRKSAFSN